MLAGASWTRSRSDRVTHVFSPAGNSRPLWIGVRLLKEAVDDHQEHARAQQRVGDVEDVREHIARGPRGIIHDRQSPRPRPMKTVERVDHVAHFAEADAVVQVPQHACQQHAEQDVIAVLSAFA